MIHAHCLFYQVSAAGEECRGGSSGQQQKDGEDNGKRNREKHKEPLDNFHSRLLNSFSADLEERSGYGNERTMDRYDWIMRMKGWEQEK